MIYVRMHEEPSGLKCQMCPMQDALPLDDTQAQIVLASCGTFPAISWFTNLQYPSISMNAKQALPLAVVPLLLLKGQ